MENGDILIGGSLVAAITALGFWGIKTVNDKKTALAKLAVAAQPVAKETGIPLSFIVTQAAHESNYGRSGLAVKSNNLFGIKAGASWTGWFDNWPTWENVNGKDIKIIARFRRYADWGESIRDWAKLITSRYPKALAAAKAGNAKQFFEELQKGGYATDPNYATKLVGVYQSLEAVL